MLRNPSGTDIRVESAEVEPPDAGFAVVGPLPPLVVPAGGQVRASVQFAASDSGDFRGILRLQGRSPACSVETAAELQAHVPMELYPLQLWMEHYVARPGDTVRLPIWLQGAVQRARVQGLTFELVFDPALLLPVELRSANSSVPFTYDGNGRLRCTIPIAAAGDANTPQRVATLVGIALGSLPPETPLHFADAQVQAEKHTTLTLTDGRLTVLFCGISRFGIRASSWATVQPRDNGIAVRLSSPVQQQWTLRLLTLEGRQCWYWHGIAGGEYELVIPTHTLAAGAYLLVVSTAQEGELLRLLLPLAR